MMTSVTGTMSRRLVRSLVFAAGFTAITVMAAKCRLYVPFTEIPFTLQTMVVVLAGLMLGSRLAAISQFQYMLLGLAGAPVFASGLGGPAAFLSPSFGYIPGFIVGAYVTGLAYEKLGRHGFRNAAAAGVLGTCAIYLIGTPYLAVWTMIHTGKPALQCAAHAWAAGMMPFVVIDIFKAVIAAGVATSTHATRWIAV